MKIKSETVKSKSEKSIIIVRRNSIWKPGKYIQLWRMTGIRRVTPKKWSMNKKDWGKNSRWESLWNLIPSKACWIWFNQCLKMYLHRTSRKLECTLQHKAVGRSQLPRKKNYGSTPSTILGVIMDSKIKVFKGEMIELLVW